MKKKTLIILAVVLVVVIAAVAAAAVGAVNDSPFTRLGEIFGRQSRMSLSGGDVVARVGGHEVTAQQVEDERAYREMGMSVLGSADADDREIARDLLRETLVADLALERGLYPSQEEIDNLLESTRVAYSFEDGKKQMDEFFASAGITLEEYLDILAERTPRMLAKQELRDELGREYCAANGLEFTKVNPPAGMNDYVDQRIDELLESEMNSIECFIG